MVWGCIRGGSWGSVQGRWNLRDVAERGEAVGVCENGEVRSRRRLWEKWFEVSCGELFGVFRGEYFKYRGGV